MQKEDNNILGKKLNEEEVKEFIERNYSNIMKVRKEEEEERLLKPKYLESETYFIPHISTKSKSIAEGRGDDIHLSLFQEATYLKDKKESLIVQK